MTTRKYKSWVFTVRPLMGLTSETEEQIIKWLKKQSYGAAYIEQIGEDESSRHMHAQIWCDTAIDRKSANQGIERIMARTIKDCTETQLKVMRMGTKIPHSDWIIDYCEKNIDKDEPVCVYENYPECTADYYPSLDEQEACMRKSNAVDKRMQNLEELWLEWMEPGMIASKYNVARFLSDMAFKSRKICVPKDQRTRIDLAKSLEYYLCKEDIGAGFLTKEDLSLQYELGLIQMSK